MTNTKMVTTTVDENGDVTIPLSKEFVEKYGWLDGDDIRFDIELNGLVVKNISAKARKLSLVCIKTTSYAYYAVNSRDKEHILANLEKIYNNNPLREEKGSTILSSVKATNYEEIAKVIEKGNNTYTWIGSQPENCITKI